MTIKSRVTLPIFTNCVLIILLVVIFRYNQILSSGMISRNSRLCITFDRFLLMSYFLGCFLNQSIIIATFSTNWIWKCFTLFRRSCFKWLGFTSWTNFLLSTHYMGPQKVRQIWIIVLRFILIFQQRLNLRFLSRSVSKNRVFSWSKSISFFTI